MSDAVWPTTKPGDVLVMDRNYVDFALIAWAVITTRFLVIRCATKSGPSRGHGFSIIQEFWESSDDERKVALRGAIVTLTLPASPNTRRFVRKNHLPESVQVRLKVAL